MLSIASNRALKNKPHDKIDIVSLLNQLLLSGHDFHIDYFISLIALFAVKQWVESGGEKCRRRECCVLGFPNIPKICPPARCARPIVQQDKGLLTPSKHCFLSQLVRYSSEGVLQLGPLGSTAFLPDSKCLVDDGKGRTPTLKKCEDVLRPAQRFWDFTQVGKSSGSLEEINWRGMML